MSTPGAGRSLNEGRPDRSPALYGAVNSRRTARPRCRWKSSSTVAGKRPSAHSARTLQTGSRPSKHKGPVDSQGCGNEVTPSLTDMRGHYAAPRAAVLRRRDWRLSIGQESAAAGVRSFVREWRATADEDGHYCFAVALMGRATTRSTGPIHDALRFARRPTRHRLWDFAEYHSSMPGRSTERTA
jgi:hypothetical protein